MRRMNWQQGEHVVVLGTTGSGKTHAALRLVDTRRYVIVFEPKPEDDTTQELIDRYGWIRIGSIDQMPQPELDDAGRPLPVRIILWPKYETLEDQENHAEIYGKALATVFAQGHWTVFLDELSYYSDFLGLKRTLDLCFRQGRSIRLTLISASQRPRYIPLEAMNQATHTFLFRTNDELDFKRLTEIAGPVDKSAMLESAQSLRFNKHEFLYVNSRTGEMLIASAPKGIR